MDKDRLETFKRLYALNLTECVQKHADYAYSAADLPKVIERMHAAIDRGSYNKDGHAFKATCKQLGIKHTYKAINAYLER